MLDTSKIGYEFPPFSGEVEKGRLRLFAKAIGETNPVYIDEAAAQAAGHRSLPVPPTLLALGMDPDPFDFLEVFGADIAVLLHGEQSMEYYESVCAGDRLQGRKRVTDVFEKKGGALQFIIMQIDYYNQDNELVCKTKQTMILKR